MFRPQEGSRSLRQPDGCARCSAELRLSLRFVAVAIAASLLCSYVKAQGPLVCDPQCQAGQASALSRFQAGLLAPGQDPELLTLYPGVAAARAAGAAKAQPLSKALSLPTTVTAAGLPGSPAPSSSAYMPAHCSETGAPRCCCLCCTEGLPRQLHLLPLLQLRMFAGIVCCRPDGLAYYQPANAEATAIFPCYHYYGIIAIYYPDMMLGGTLLDDVEMWSSLDSILTFIVSGRTSAEHHQ